MKAKIIVCAVALGSLMSLSAAGMSGGMQNRTSFTDFDLNNDGAITKEEFLKVRAQKQEARAKAGYPMRNVANAPSFESIDANSDGKITPDEFTAFQNTRMQNRMGQKGQGMGQMKNSNNMVGIKRNRSSFTDFDFNNDGVIIKEELLKLRAQKQEARAKAGYPMRNVANAPSFESIDANNDGKITPDEFSSRFN